MTAPDTPAIRAQMEALAGHTAGPWFAERDECHFGTLSSIRGGSKTPQQGLACELMVEVGGHQSLNAMEATTRLIAAAPTMRATILTLCGEVDRLRAENERLQSALSSCVDNLLLVLHDQYDGVWADADFKEHVREFDRILAQSDGDEG